LYADDIVLIAETEDQLSALMDKVHLAPCHSICDR
jgi:hypothetical protein